MVVSAHHAASAQPAPQAGGSLNGWLGAVYELLNMTLVTWVNTVLQMQY